MLVYMLSCGVNSDFYNVASTKLFLCGLYSDLESKVTAHPL